MHICEGGVSSKRASSLVTLGRFCSICRQVESHSKSCTSQEEGWCRAGSCNGTEQGARHTEEI